MYILCYGYNQLLVRAVGTLGLLSGIEPWGG